MAYVRRLPSLEYAHCSRSISLTLYPIILSTLGGSTVFWKIDLVSGFHQIRIHDKDVEKTALNTQFGPWNGLLRPLASVTRHRRSNAS